MDSTNISDKSMEEESVARQLHRIPKAGRIAGVCAGLSTYLAIDVTVLRIIFIVLTIASGGFGIILYFILALIMPVSENSKITYPTNDIGQNFAALSAEMKGNGSVDRLRNFLGVFIALTGVWLLLGQLFPGWLYLNWDAIWPIILIGLGGLIIYRRI